VKRGWWEYYGTFYQTAMRERFNTSTTSSSSGPDASARRCRGTTNLKVLDRKLPFARIDRVRLHADTRTSGAGEIPGGIQRISASGRLLGLRCIFQARTHARRYVYKALEWMSNMGPALHLIARLCAVEDRAKALSLSAEQRLALRQRVSARLPGETSPVSAGPAARGFAEESVWRGRALCIESVGSPDALSG
jgi:hypothetical protein